MSDVISEAVTALNEKLSGEELGGTVKFHIQGEGSVVVDDSGARASDDDADVTLTADTETFQDMMSGNLNPTAAFMSGKLTLDGDMGLAMKLGSVLG
ncbi:MAG: SCP2 sterol-binding domain-containing protein [Paracoccaceae bacterium]